MELWKRNELKSKQILLSAASRRNRWEYRGWSTWSISLYIMVPMLVTASIYTIYAFCCWRWLRLDILAVFFSLRCVYVCVCLHNPHSNQHGHSSLYPTVPSLTNYLEQIREQLHCVSALISANCLNNFKFTKKKEITERWIHCRMIFEYKIL